ncbi:PKHA7 protein, partial [Polyodon spathula]|nr:PKHA7 protein [Polyodon spathula]
MSLSVSSLYCLLYCLSLSPLSGCLSLSPLSTVSVFSLYCLSLSSLSTVSPLSTVSLCLLCPQGSGSKLHSFGKRGQSIRRDPNSAVVIRGWLFKQDSSGLKLWKRRWFVLADYCLFYYRDSREETVLGSIPLPSYSILSCDPSECKNRKFTFKVIQNITANERETQRHTQRHC